MAWKWTRNSTTDTNKTTRQFVIKTTENKVNKLTYPALEAIFVLLRNKYIVWRLQSGCPLPAYSASCNFVRIIIVNSITLNVRQNICQCENFINAICARLCVRQFMHEHNDVRWRKKTWEFVLRNCMTDVQRFQFQQSDKRMRHPRPRPLTLVRDHPLNLCHFI